MYDAVNRGLRRASGEILSYLNCDEQYLPGALPAVGAYFKRHPEVEMVFGNCLVVGPQGEFICYRKVPEALEASRDGVPSANLYQLDVFPPIYPGKTRTFF